jgi:uncharacterized protein
MQAEDTAAVLTKHVRASARIYISINMSIDTQQGEVLPATLYRTTAMEEELAGPPPALAPTDRGERISSMDLLRGVALLGILIANVTEMGIPSWNYFVPLGMAKPAFEGAHAHLNTVVWFARWLVMEGKMRGLFSILFGAGVILLTSRAEKRGAGIRVADIFLRRNLWLLLFGILHAYFIWFGDVLYYYALCALIFLFPCRNLRPRTLLLAGAGVLAVSTCVGPFSGGIPLQDVLLHPHVVAAEQAQKAGRALTDEQKTDLQTWAEHQEEWRPSRQTIDADLAAKRGGYISAQLADVAGVKGYEEFSFYGLGFCDVLGMMFLGMGLIKNGFLTAQLSYRTYALTALIAGSVSLTLVSMATWHAWSSGFDMLTSEKWLFFTMDPGRTSGAIAIAAIVMLVAKARLFPGIAARVAAVGQTALTNYLLTSLICKYLFVWGPWKLYDRLEYYQLYYVVVAVWVFNLAWSAAWMRYFEFGPFEWVWRSLTYWKPQRMRVAASR